MICKSNLRISHLAGILAAVGLTLSIMTMPSAQATGDPAGATALQDRATSTLALVRTYKRERVYRGDYMVTCRTDGSCDAITFTDTPTATGGNFSSSLTFKRAASPGTAWILTFSGAFEGPVSGTPIEVRIGRQSWFLAYNQGYSDRIGTLVGHNYFLYPVNEQIVSAMLAGNMMDIQQTIKGGGKQTVRYSLRGLSASMRWVDQRQNRVGQPMLVGVPMSLEEAIPQ
jgi:hypothetical protein